MENTETEHGRRYWISRVEGVKEMLTLFGRMAFEYLIISLWDQDKWVRIAAADALADMQDTRAYQFLVPMLNDTDQDIRFAVAASLGRLGDKRAVEPLKCACRDQNYYVRQVARESLEILSGNEDTGLWSTIPGVFKLIPG